eukprot:TRINITY_DN32816_c0_g1_i1.p1 TRINITY_DN32816_c0_g1~~TRINITY_DN32816_c0_g1_i1.p1  ORF type:complete len:154 (-),score=6.04 TRINITY_DN32816_c0_g1_i1:80-541(-)
MAFFGRFNYLASVCRANSIGSYKVPSRVGSPSTWAFTPMAPSRHYAEAKKADAPGAKAEPAKKPAAGKKKGAKVVGEKRKINIYNYFKNMTIEPTKREDVPEWFVKMTNDYIEKKGDFAPLSELNPGMGRIYFRKLNRQKIKEQNFARRKSAV